MRVTVSSLFAFALLILFVSGCYPPASETPPISPDADQEPVVQQPNEELSPVDATLSALMEEVSAGNTDAMLAAADIYRDPAFPHRALQRSGALIIQAALLGNVNAMVRAGDLYQGGYGYLYSEPGAAEWYRKAADASSPTGARKLGDCYARAKGVEKNPEEAFNWFLRAAEAGEPVAQLRLADAYTEGKGTEKDDAQAAIWLAKGRTALLNAAESGEPEAQYEMGAFTRDHSDRKVNPIGATVPIKVPIGGVVDDSFFGNDFSGIPLGLEWLKKAAEQGYAPAQSWLGDHYEGNRASRRLAIEWYRKAAEQGYVPAQNSLGLIYTYLGNATESEMRQGFEWYRKAAEQGDPSAQWSLANCYKNGTGVLKDGGLAFQWYRKAAEQGDRSAQRYLGDCYKEGTGVPKDEGQATEWYRRAAENGDGFAQLEIAYRYATGTGLPHDEKQAFQWYETAADNRWLDGLPLAELARRYELGLGVQVDTEQAKNLREKSISDMTEDKLIVHQFFGAPYIASCYDSANYVLQDPREAFRWYLVAAEHGHLESQVAVAQRYSEGQGTEKDAKQATDWYRKAAEQGSAFAQAQLGWRCSNGEGVKKDMKQAVEWYRKAADQGQTSAQNNLGVCYANGEGVEKNYREAVTWYRRAAQQGMRLAQMNLGRMLLSGHGMPKDDIEAYKWLNLAAVEEDQAGPLRDALAFGMTAEQVAEAQRRSSQFQPQTWEQIKAQEASGGTDSETGAQIAAGQSPKGNATAFIITRDGYAVTAAHVVNAANRITLSGEGKQVSAVIVAQDAANDLAILKAEGEFSSVAVRPSAGVQSGAEVCTVGFPNVVLQGSAPKVTRGHINALSGVQNDPRFFQISAQVHPGNSGGALIDMAGHVIGIVVGEMDEFASLAVSGALPQNVNYAVKSSYLLPLLETIPALAAKLNEPPPEPPSTPEEAIAALQAATYLVLVY